MNLPQTSKGNEDADNKSEFWCSKRKQNQHNLATIWIWKASEERIKNNEVTQVVFSNLEALS